MSRAEEIIANLEALERRIEAACARADRPRADVQLVAVTKTFPATDVQFAVACGIGDIGENKVQEARDKKPLVEASARWHLIGHLQSNKVKEAVRLFDVIQTVDSADLATKIGKAAAAAGKTQQILLQINIGREPQKSGVDPRDVDDLASAVAAIPAVQLSGVMAIPPPGDAEEMRPWFRDLRVIRERLVVPHLSMGMTDDFEIAVEEGATIIRVGRAIFGAR